MTKPYEGDPEKAPSWASARIAEAESFEKYWAGLALGAAVLYTAQGHAGWRALRDRCELQAQAAQEMGDAVRLMASGWHAGATVRELVPVEAVTGFDYQVAPGDSEAEQQAALAAFYYVRACVLSPPVTVVVP